MSDPLPQAAVAGQAVHVVDAGVLTPGQDGLAAEAGIPPQDDACAASAHGPVPLVARDPAPRPPLRPLAPSAA